MFQAMQSSPFSTSGRSWWSRYLSVCSIPYFVHIFHCTHSATCHGATDTLSGQASWIHRHAVGRIVSLEFPHNLYSDPIEVLSILWWIKFVLKSCSWAAMTKPSVYFLKNPFQSHLNGSSSAISDVCGTSSPCRTFSFQFLTLISYFLLFDSLGDSLWPLSPSPLKHLEASHTPCSLWGIHVWIFSQSVHTPQC